MWKHYLPASCLCVIGELPLSGLGALFLYPPHRRPNSQPMRLRQQPTYRNLFHQNLNLSSNKKSFYKLA